VLGGIRASSEPGDHPIELITSTVCCMPVSVLGCTTQLCAVLCNRLLNVLPDCVAR
jgi:hypothetical protein